MELIRLKNARQGMKIAREVVDHQGNVLMQPGTDLSERTIEKLVERGIESLWVEIDCEQNLQDIGKMKLRMSDDLDAVFEGRLDDELMAYIHSRAKSFLTGKLEN